VTLIKQNQIWFDGKNKIIQILDSEEILGSKLKSLIYFDDGYYKYAYSYNLFLSFFELIGEL